MEAPPAASPITMERGTHFLRYPRAKITWNSLASRWRASERVVIPRALGALDSIWVYSRRSGLGKGYPGLWGWVVGSAAMSGEERCWRCGARLRGWEAYCPLCGARLGPRPVGAFEKAWSFVSSPGGASARILPRESGGSALRFLALLALLPAAGALVLTLYTLSLLAPALPFLGGSLRLLGPLLACLAFAFGWLGPLGVVALGASLTLAVLRASGVRVGYGEAFAAVAYSESPALLAGPLLAVPFFGGVAVFAAGLYGLVILYKAVRRGYGAGLGAGLGCAASMLLLHSAAAVLLLELTPSLGALIRLVGGG